MKLTESEEKEICDFFRNVYIDWGKLSRKYQPGAERDFYNLCIANLGTLFSMAYGDNSVLILLDLAKTLAVTINKKRGLLIQQDGILVGWDKEGSGCQKKEI